MKLSSPQFLKTIAGLINARYIGNDNFIVSGINEIHMVQPGDLTFVDHPKYYDKALNSQATTILIDKEVECPSEKALIISDDPCRDYNFLTKHFRPLKLNTTTPASDAKIGEGTVIMPNGYIGNNVTIGQNCIIYPNVVIYDHTSIGDNVIIQAGTILGSDAFYYKKRPTGFDKMHSCGRLIIENNVEIGASCTIDRGVSGDTIIGEGSKLDNQIHIGHDTTLGKNCLIAAQTGVAGCVTIEDNVILWGQVGVQKDLTIGKNAIVLGKSGVSKSLAGDKVYFGTIAREARDAMKDLAFLKKIPDFLERIK